MEQWYVPITILPGICLLILSTSNIMIGLSKEIRRLLADPDEENILIERKLLQMKLINRAMVFLYLSVAAFVVSGLLSGIAQTISYDATTSIYLLIIGMAFAMFALLSLIIYSFRAVKIRQDQYHDKC
jgi:FtsH-binding integral membrane protein